MRRLLLSFAMLLAPSAPVAAQRFDDTISLKVEAYFAGINSSARVGSTSGSLGTDIDFEDDLRLSDSKVLPAFELGWRINDDWVLRANTTLLAAEPRPRSPRTSKSVIRSSR
jgi:hypothetical protein